MRRGLKHIERHSRTIQRAPGFKPIPDEEGTETRAAAPRAIANRDRFKPIPDEEGTETTGRTGLGPESRSFKPIPDEEGTETGARRSGEVTKRNKLSLCRQMNSVYSLSFSSRRCCRPF